MDEEHPEEENFSEAELRFGQRVVGEQLWLTMRTRPDLQFVLAWMASNVSKAPNKVALVGKRVLSYLQGTAAVTLRLGRYSAEDAGRIIGYSDASFAPQGGRSVGASVVVLGGSPVTWKSGRQSFVTVSVAEAELHAATQCVVLVKSVAAVADELLNKAHEQVLRVDNTAAITILKGSGQSSWRTRHLRVRANFVKELLDEDALKIEHVAGEEQLADLATKLVPKARLQYLLILWGFQGVSGDARAEKARVATLRLLCILLATMAVGAEGREQGAGRDEEAYNGISRTGNLELLVMAGIMCVAAVAIWELEKWLFTGKEESDWRAERKLRKLERLRQLAREAAAAELDAPESARTGSASARTGSASARAGSEGARTGSEGARTGPRASRTGPGASRTGPGMATTESSSPLE